MIEPTLRYIPKVMTTTPTAFGKSSRIEWVCPSGDDSTQRRMASRVNAAQWQHSYALAIRDGVAALFDGSLNKYATGTGATYDRLVKVLRGDAVMRSEDVGLAAALIPALHTEAFAYLRRQQTERYSPPSRLR